MEKVCLVISSWISLKKQDYFLLKYSSMLGLTVFFLMSPNIDVSYILFYLV